MAFNLSEFDEVAQDVFLFASGEDQSVLDSSIALAQKDAKTIGCDSITEKEVLAAINIVRGKIMTDFAREGKTELSDELDREIENDLEIAGRALEL